MRASYEALLAATSPVPDAMRATGDLAGIFYTGGTTGRSKGVMLSHGNLIADAFNVLAEGCSRATPSICTPRRCSTWRTAPRCTRCC